MQFRAVVTGAGGFVAASVLTQAGDDWQVHAISRGEPLIRRDNFFWHTCDPLVPAQWTRLFEEIRPDAVIHTAALAGIDFCQEHPELARAVNVDLTRTIANLCGVGGCKLVFCSTDTIFDGEHAPYKEDDLPGPVNVYAETKAAAEQIVARLGAQAVIARLSLVVGLPLLGRGNSFLAPMIDAFKEGRPVGALEHEIRTPVDVITAGRALLELAAGNHHGIVHLAGHNRLSRLEMVLKIAVRFGFPEHLVTPQVAAAMPGRARRPRDVSLNNARACASLNTPMRTLDEGLSLILKSSQTPSL